MNTAKLIKRMEKFRGDARLYTLSTPWEGQHEVIVSKVTVMGEPETFIFGYDIETDDVAHWAELRGSRRGEWSHREILSGIGYEIVEKSTNPFAKIEQALDNLITAINEYKENNK